MAVRSFDLSDTPDSRLRVVEAAPRRRQDVRRSRQHWMILGGLALALPFAAAVITIGVVH